MSLTIKSLVTFLLLLTGSSLALCIWRGIVASSLDSGLRKGKNALAAGVCFGLTFCFGALSQMVIGWGLPVLEATGHIVSLQVRSHTHSHPSDLQIQEDSGEYLYLHASDRSSYFQPGRRIKVRYRNTASFAGPDSLVEATFFSDNGREEGIYRDTDTFLAYWMMACGLFFICGSFVKHRRDPEASERSWGRLADREAPTTLGLSTEPADHAR